jgi:hypothetical protein
MRYENLQLAPSGEIRTCGSANPVPAALIRLAIVVINETRTKAQESQSSMAQGTQKLQSEYRQWQGRITDTVPRR